MPNNRKIILKIKQYFLTRKRIKSFKSIVLKHLGPEVLLNLKWNLSTYVEVQPLLRSLLGLRVGVVYPKLTIFALLFATVSVSYIFKMQYNTKYLSHIGFVNLNKLFCARQVCLTLNNLFTLPNPKDIYLSHRGIIVSLRTGNAFGYELNSIYLKDLLQTFLKRCYEKPRLFQSFCVSNVVA